PGYPPQQVVENQTVVQPPLVPIAPSQTGSSLPVQEWREGLRETFVHSDVHEIRPIHQWENQYQYPQSQQLYYQQPTAITYPQYYQQPCYQQQYCQPQQWYY